jgi:uncharacterized protein
MSPLPLGRFRSAIGKAGALAGALCAFVVEPARGASFDCNKAATEVEFAICGNAELSRMDSALGEIYRERAAQDSTIRQDQIAWIRERNRRCGGSTACLKDALEARVAQLRGDATPVAAPAPTERQAIAPAHEYSATPMDSAAHEEVSKLAVENADPPISDDPLKNFVNAYFRVDRGRIICGHTAQTDRLIEASEPDRTLVQEPRITSGANGVSQSDYRLHQDWYACSLFVIERKWRSVLHEAAARVCRSVQSGAASQPEEFVAIDQLDRDCGMFASRDRGARQYLELVKSLTWRIEKNAAETVARLTPIAARQREIAAAEAAKAQEAARIVEAARQETLSREAAAKAERRAIAQEKAERDRVENERAQAAALAYDRKRCANLLAEMRKNPAATARQAQQVLDGQYQCPGRSKLDCFAIQRAHANLVSFTGSEICGGGDEAECLVAGVNNCAQFLKGQ